MRTSELRIGDWVRDETEPRIYRKLDLDDFLYIKQSEGTFAPVPITTDVLAMCGVKIPLPENDNGRVQIGIFTFQRTDQGIVLFDMELLQPMAGVIPCKYLHQLQNLYHSLTGEELKVRMLTPA